MKSKIIKSYRRIQNWENFFLDSAIYSVGQSLGITYEDGFQPISAVTGDLFAYMYSDTKPCDSGITNYIFMPEVVEIAYSMFGYSCIYISNDDINADIEDVLLKIRMSVDRDIPVLAWGCGGVVMENGNRHDPLPEGCIIGGYDDNGLLYVNLYPGAERLAKTSALGKPGVDEFGYTAIFAKDALASTKGIFIAGEKIESPAMTEVYRNVILSIPRFLSMKPQDGYAFGKQAFERWAEVLLNDEYWQTPEMAEANCWDKHCCAYCSLCTSIGVGDMGDNEGIVRYIKKAADAMPDMPIASEILQPFVKLRQLNRSIWDYHGGFMPLADRLAEHCYREHLAGILREMGGVCNEIEGVYKNLL